jgi:hypothetical protein
MNIILADMIHLEEIINQLTQYNYTRLVLFVAESAAILTGIKYYKLLAELKFMVWYLVFDFSLFVGSMYIDGIKILDIQQVHQLNETINVLVSLVEIGFYYTYFSKRIRIKKIIRINISILILGILGALIFYELTNKNILQSYTAGTHFISTLSFLLIFPLAITNLKYLLNDEKIESIHSDSHFWITLGILYYSSTSTPHYFFRGFFELDTNLKIALDSVLFYTPFTLNIICILIAFLCKKPAKN